jgi:hypothetical protein
MSSPRSVFPITSLEDYRAVPSPRMVVKDRIITANETMEKCIERNFLSLAMVPVRPSNVVSVEILRYVFSVSDDNLSVVFFELLKSPRGQHNITSDIHITIV